MHLTEGELRAYTDQELNDQARHQLESHLKDCATCQERAQSVTRRAEVVRLQMESLAPQSPEVANPVPIARARLTNRLAHEKETKSMWSQLNKRRFRPVMMVVVVVIGLVLAFAFPQVRAVANHFLGLFRVQQVAIVEINPANLREIGNSATFEELLAENVEVEEFGERRQVADAREALAVTDVDIRLPTSFDTAPQIWTQKGAQVSFSVDRDRTHAILDEIGRADIQLPNEIDDATVVLTIPKSVFIGYGECDFEGVAVEDASAAPGKQANCTVLVQTPSPTISAPPGLNLPELGKSFLQLMGLTAEEAEKFSETVDWTTTLILPIPRYNVQYQYVEVDGVTGTLIQEQMSRPDPMYMLVWVKENVVYVLTGQGDGEIQGIPIAESLK